MSLESKGEKLRILDFFRLAIFLDQEEVSFEKIATGKDLFIIKGKMLSLANNQQ